MPPHTRLGFALFALLFFRVRAFREEIYSRKKAQKAQKPSRRSGFFCASCAFLQPSGLVEFWLRLRRAAPFRG